VQNRTLKACHSEAQGEALGDGKQKVYRLATGKCTRPDRAWGG
jgi:hypothetical protein